MKAMIIRTSFAAVFVAAVACAPQGTGDTDAGFEEEQFCLAACNDDPGCAVEFVGDTDTLCDADGDCDGAVEACVEGLGGNNYCAVLAADITCSEFDLVEVNATRVGGGSVAVCGANATCEDDGFCGGDAVGDAPDCSDDDDCGGGAAFSCVAP